MFIAKLSFWQFNPKLPLIVDWKAGQFFDLFYFILFIYF